MAVTDVNINRLSKELVNKEGPGAKLNWTMKGLNN